MKQINYSERSGKYFMVNNELFKVKIENFHPVSQKYERLLWWKTQIRRCIEGFWAGNVWMPGELYYYVNFHYITMEKGIYRGLSLPWLRDIDWEMFYLYAEASGFSGFELDEEFSCNRLLIDKLYTDEDLKNLAGDDPKFINNFFKQDGTRKTYVEARDYLRKTFTKVLGKPLFFNSAKHILLMAARGLGKSYSSSGFIAHNFLFAGAKDYDDYLHLKSIGNPLKTETVVGAIDAKYSGKLIDKVKTALDKLPGYESITVNGELVKYPSPLSLTSEGSFAVGKAYKAISTGSQIQHVTFADNPLAANGGRPNKIFLDEIGFFNSILETWEAIESTQANEVFKRLSIIGTGTGGLTTSGAATYVRDIFYNPEAYNCLAFEDTWEKTGKIGYFIDTLHSTNEFKEGKNLVTNKDRALTSVLREREKAKQAKSKTKLLGLIINKPLVPSEIFLRMEGNFFPTQELKEILAELETNKRLLDASWKVDLFIDGSGKVQARPSNKIPIRDYPLTRNVDMDACIELFEKPKEDSSGEIVSNRYFICLDPVDDDGNDNINRSLQSMYVYDSWTDRLVAEYTARTEFASDYYENARKLALYYNARILYENNKKGLYTHFKNKASTHLLLPVPEILKEQNFVKSVGIGNKSLGVNMSSDKMKLMAIELLKEWLAKKAYTESGEEESEKQNMHILRSPALLKELIAFTMSTNCDRVSALLVLMILIADKKRAFEQIKQTGVLDENELRDKAFWQRAYKGVRVNRSNVYNNVNPLSKFN